MKNFPLLQTIAFTSMFALVGCIAQPGVAAPAPQSNPGIGQNNRAANPAVRVTLTAAQARQLATNLQLTGRRALPPGIQRNLARGKPLPPGIAKQVVPQNMLNGLPQYPNHEWGIAGTDLILIQLGTQLLVEVLADVFR